MYPSMRAKAGDFRRCDVFFSGKAAVSSLLAGSLLLAAAAAYGKLGASHSAVLNEADIIEEALEAKDGNCYTSKPLGFCKAGKKCYSKNAQWAACLGTPCRKGQNPHIPGDPNTDDKWTCELIGGAPPKPVATGGIAPDDYIILPCDDDEADCKEAEGWQTAQHGGYYCREGGGCSPWSIKGGAFPKDVCKDQCSIGYTPTTRTSTITSTTITTTTITTTYPGMDIKLFCWSLAMPGYEFDILRRQHELYAGIFSCDEQAVMSFEDLTIGDGDMEIHVMVCPNVEVGTSKDGTAGNALQFMKAWDVIKNDGMGRYANTDWTVKVDPDAVMLADRLRIHLNPHNGGNVYVRNCDKPMSEGTMMFGSLEAISKLALDTYYANHQSCEDEIPWQTWGEDLYMMRCLEHVGVGIVEDFSLVQDGVCKGKWCGDQVAAVFHPLKDVGSWEGCWGEAIAGR